MASPRAPQVMRVHLEGVGRAACEPTTACQDHKITMHILQHAMVLARPGSDKLPAAQMLTRSLQQGYLLVQAKKGKKLSGFADAAGAVYSFLKEYNSQGAEPPAAGKKWALITRLAGGILAWKGERKFASDEEADGTDENG
eukprot:400736-Prymnesium_polylepis.2